MNVLPQFAIGVGVGVYLQRGKVWPAAFWTGTTLAITQTVLHPIQTTKAVYGAAQYVWTTTPQEMAATASRRILLPAAGVALAAVGGMVVGTVISQQIWGDKGAQEALGFYGFDSGHEPNYWEQDGTPGYFNIPGNLGIIYDHYVANPIGADW